MFFIWCCPDEDRKVTHRKLALNIKQFYSAANQRRISAKSCLLFLPREVEQGKGYRGLRSPLPCFWLWRKDPGSFTQCENLSLKLLALIILRYIADLQIQSPRGSGQRAMLGISQQTDGARLDRSYRVTAFSSFNRPTYTSILCHLQHKPQ